MRPSLDGFGLCVVVRTRSRVDRYYDPQTGQFLSVDPLVDITEAPYGYASDNPMSNIDPLGDVTAPAGSSHGTYEFIPVPERGSTMDVQAAAAQETYISIYVPGSGGSVIDIKADGDPLPTLLADPFDQPALGVFTCDSQAAEEEAAVAADPPRIYEPYDKHPPHGSPPRLDEKGRIVSPQPRNGQAALDVSEPLSANSQARIGIDPETGETVVLPLTRKVTDRDGNVVAYIHHGYVKA